MGERYHELKTWPEPYEAMLSGAKPFEFRRDDRGFTVGDMVCCREWAPEGALRGSYTGRWSRWRVTYVLHGGRFGVPDGFVVLGVTEISRGETPSKFDSPPYLTAKERAA